MSLVRLPNETIQNILCRLGACDLAMTALVCRRLNTLTHDPLYRHIDLPRPLFPDRTAPLTLLLRTLLHRNPTAPAHTLSLRVHNQEVENYNAEFSEDLVDLLTLLPHLEVFHLWPILDHRPSRWVPFDPDDDPFFASMHVFDPSLLPAALQNLREFDSRTTGPEEGAPVGMLMLLMGLPRLRRLAMYIDDNDTVPPVHRRSGVTRLELVGGWIPLEVLGAILQIPRALTSFTYVGSCELSHELAGLGKALLPLKDTLVHLVVDIVTAGPEEYVYGSEDTVGSFCDWPCLESLELALTLLFGRGGHRKQQLVGLLPRGLRTLRVREDRYWDAEAVQGKLVRLLRSGQCGMLREMGVGRDSADCRVMAVACERAGVQLVGECWAGSGRLAFIG